MRQQFVAFFLVMLFTGTVSAQELEFNVSVSAPTVDNADPKIFKKLEGEISELINGTQWTEDSFEDHEKIKGQITLTVTAESTATSFQAELAIITARPIYKSTSTSQLIKYLDRNVTFTYDGIRPIQRTDNNYVDNLSSIITYYAYIILAMDYDSFSPNGGTPYWDKAFELYNSLPSGLQRSDKGWTPDDTRGQNRYFLLENARNPSLRSFRAAYYEYHRLALDSMHEDPEKSRAVLMSAITQIGETEKSFPRTIMVRMFSDAKKIELKEIFKGGSTGEKSKIKKIMTQIDPSNSSVFNNLR